MAKTLQILGTGCPKCAKLTELARQAADSMGIDYRIEKVSDLREIMKFGVMSTPALVVDGQVKCMGRLPAVDELKALIGG